jgi:hypothetical protein
MTSIEDKLQTLQHKVSSLDKTGDTSSEPMVGKSYNKYIYVLLVFFVCLFVLVWLQPAFLVTEEKTVNGRTIVKTKKLNKMKTGASAAVMCGSVVGGWYWYTNKNSRNKN